jgi:MFS family permease
MAAAVPRARQAFAFGVLRTATPAAGLLAGLAVPGLGVRFGWEAAFVVAAVLVAATVPFVGSCAPTTSVHHREPVKLGPAAPLVVLTISMALGAGVVNVLSGFFVASSVAAGLEQGTAGLVLAAGSALGIGARLAAGWLADRARWDYLTGVAVLFAGGCVGCLLLAAGAGTTLFLGALLAFGLGWAWPGLMQVAVVSRYRATPAAATGYTQTGGFVGSFMAPVGFAVVATSASYSTAWAATAAVAAAAAALALFCARVFPDARARTSGAVPAIATVEGGTSGTRP